MAPAFIVSVPLVLSRDAVGHHLHCSLHTVSDPQLLAVKLKRRDKQDLAIINASRLVSTNQLVCAANMAIHRANPTWDVVFLVASSSHLGHVMRDYAFLEQENNGDGNQQQDSTAATTGPPAAVVLVSLAKDHLPNSHKELLSQYNEVGECLDIEDFFANQDQGRLKKWYKVTDEEVLNSSLEACVLTKISTKMIM